MIGPQGTSVAVAEALAARLPERVAVLDAELGQVPLVDRDTGEQVDVQDPTPRFVSWSQQPAMAVRDDQWPFVLVVPQRTVSMVWQELDDDGADVYEVTYDLRVFMWVRSSGFENTSALQRRLVLVVREVLLSRRQLAEWMKVDPTSLNEQLSGVADSDTLGSSVAGAYVQVSVKVQERLTPARPPLGQPQTGTIPVGVLGGSDTP